MTAVENYYTLAEFNEIKLLYVKPLDKYSTDVISYLEKTIVIPPAEPENITKKMDRLMSDNRHKKGKKNVSNSFETQDEWNKMRQFKSTTVENKEGIDKSFTDIRILMNKLSLKNYDTQKVPIFSVLEEICGENSNISLENKTRALNIILDIVCGNRFYSELYADLYKELANRFEIFFDSLPFVLKRYSESLEKIHYVDHNVDYDGFCNYTKTNDLRKANASFIVQLMKKDVLSKNELLSVLCNLVDLLNAYIDEENRINEFDEITENLFLIITQSKGFIETEKTWMATVLPAVQNFSKQSAKDHKSLSSRAVFKYMDIMESLRR